MATSENPGASVPGEYSVDDEDQLQPEDTLIERGPEDILDEGISPPERPLALEPHDTLDARLEEEEPDGALDTGTESGDRTDYPSRTEVGDVRAGRLVAPDEGTGEDVDKDLIGTDVGIDGAGASAEEAAVHRFDEGDVDTGVPPER
ncbi:DUF5709 domain-containing protein [Rhodococcus yananensis]|uniref:DUF5709 domain-containing protein n=1 Tax=Rhodococcus yananensis TaxID=2879464 RepID=UPI001CF8AF24|nr:DUF5709 domain-containing protein [Rhodococcus yananensis]